MNWLDEGALYSQISLFLREDLGRGDITTQSIIARNTRARARFVAGQNMIVAGLEAAEEVFLTLDSQQQLEAFVSDGEPVEAGKVIARMIGFADVLISAERVALNILQRLSGIATLTEAYVKAVAGTGAQIADTRATTPGLPLNNWRDGSMATEMLWYTCLGSPSGVRRELPPISPSPRIIQGPGQRNRSRGTAESTATSADVRRFAHA